MKKSNVVSFIVLVCLIALPIGAFALPISGIGDRGGSFSGSIEYVPGNSTGSAIGSASIGPADVAVAADVADAAGAYLVINLTNTSRREGLYLSVVSLTSPYLEAKEEIFLDVGRTASISFSLGDRSFSRLTAESFLGEGSEFIIYFSDADRNMADQARVAAVSEPSTMLLLGFGLLVIGVGLRKRMR
jgi:hypothetical protein